MSILSPGISKHSASSRRCSIQSAVSSLSPKSRSLLSGEGAEKAPVLEGNIQLQGGYECGEKVIRASPFCQKFKILNVTPPP